MPSIHLARNHLPAEVAENIRSGRWTRARRGAYVEQLTAAHPADARRHLALARLVAIREQMRIPYVLSHESAALLWGLPLLSRRLRTHVVQHSNPSLRDARDVVRHVTNVPEDQRTVHLGHPVTTLERTVVDCTMTLSPREGLMVADAALHVGADRRRCLEILDGMAGRRGVVVARAVLELADDGAESPGESSARFVLLRAGLPVPATQIEIRTDLGTFWADMGWAQWRLLAEYDGRAKYEAGGSASEAVIWEKRRQEAIEEAGWRVLRLTKEDLEQPGTVIRRLARHLPPGAVDELRTRRPLTALRPPA